MIESLKNYDKIKVTLFGKEKEVEVFCTGDNQYDENGNDKDEHFDLNEKELEVLNWFLENVKIEDYRQEITDYCNEEYEMWSDKQIKPEDVENEIRINSIAINVTENWQSNPVNGNVVVYPEISFYGDCKCDEEHGICIGFRDKKYLGIGSTDWTL